MLDQKGFFEKYPESKSDFEALGVPWEVLASIHEDYSKIWGELEIDARWVVENLGRIEQVHSLRLRIKNPEHLIKKLIRKKMEDQAFDVDVSTYREKITDLIGVRALHLFKEDWSKIHDFVMTTLKPCETPTANIRKGDPEDLIEDFKNRNCVIKEHKAGYRSVHYLIKLESKKVPIIAEIQVRTLVEEAWSEIDHIVRYPDQLGVPLINGYLQLFNRLAGAVDEMGSYVIGLKAEISALNEMAQRDAEEVIRESAQTIDAIRGDSDMAEKAKLLLAEKLKKLANNRSLQSPRETKARLLLRDLDGLKLSTDFPHKCQECGGDLGRLRGPLCAVCRARLG